MNFTFLSVDLALLFLFVVLIFVNRSSFSLLTIASALICGFCFSCISWLFAEFGVQTVGFTWEEAIFYPLLGMVGLQLYHVLNARFPDNSLEKFSLSLSNLMLGIGLGVLFFTYTKWLSVVSFGLLFLLLLYIEYLNKLRFMYRLYRAYFVALLFIWPAYYILVNQSLLSYRASEVMLLNIGGVPIELTFLFMTLLLSCVYFFEWLKNKYIR